MLTQLNALLGSSIHFKRLLPSVLVLKGGAALCALASHSSVGKRDVVGWGYSS